MATDCEYGNDATHHQAAASGAGGCRRRASPTPRSCGTNSPHEDHHLQLVDVIRSLRTHWRASLGLLLLSGVALGLFLFTRSEARDPDRWQASVQLLVPARTEDGQLPEGVPPSLLQGQSGIALSQETTAQALEAAGLGEGARDHVTFGFSSNERGDIHTLTVTAPQREQAVELRDRFADAYVAARRAAVGSAAEGRRAAARQALDDLEERLASVDEQLAEADPVLLSLLEASEQATGDDREAAAVELPPDTPLDTVLLAYERQSLVDRIETTQRSYAESSAEAVVPGSYATVVERPAPRQITPELPSPLVPIGVAVGVGLLLALAVPVLLDRLDHSIRDPRAAGSALAAPVLSTIPATSAAQLTTLARPGSPRDGAYRRLAAASIATDELPRAIVVTAPVGHIQDSVAANFAAALAGLGLKVALVATDERQAWFSDTEAGTLPTLPDYLALAHRGQLNGHLTEHLAPTPVENLRVVPHGTTRTDALIDGLPPLLQALADADIDVTVIAGPAMLEEPAATILAWSTRRVLWVVEAGEVSDQEAREAAARLALAGATPFGVALVDAKG